MNKTIAAAATLALIAGGCSPNRQSSSTCNMRHEGIVRIETHDSLRYTVTACIDSPEILVVSPTLPEGRAIVRGQRIRATAVAEQVSHTGTTAEQQSAIATANTEDQRRPGPTWRVAAVMCAAAAMIFFIIGRKSHKLP